MRTVLELAVRSLLNRRATALLTVLSIACAVVLLLGVERLRHESRESFTSTLSGTDLIVGARSSPVHLLLYSVFHVGNATNNLSWESYRAIAQRPEVAWTIPLSLGDTHGGFRVLGTGPEFFEHFRFGTGRALELRSGQALSGPRDAVLGAEVAAKLRYRLGERIVVAHGAGDVSFSLHRQHPFVVAGILRHTGTPVDRTVLVRLDGMDAMHQPPAARSDVDPLDAALAARRGAAPPSTAPRAHHHETRHAAAPGPQASTDGHSAHGAITAFLVGLKSRPAVLSMQRQINEYRAEPLTAILPAATLPELWEIVGAVEKALFGVSVLVTAVGLTGMLVALLTSLNERRREMAVLRSVGARPTHVFALIVGEAAVLTLTGVAIGIALLYAGLAIGQPWLEARMGLFVPIGWPSMREAGLAALVAVAGIIIGLLPGYRMYRQSLADGMTIRV
ncbi:MAG: ABC transporter permease [Burkholderiales bacterium]|nr:ABC transporter permease [Burkholderiales bacterium]